MYLVVGQQDLQRLQKSKQGLDSWVFITLGYKTSERMPNGSHSSQSI